MDNLCKKRELSKKDYNLTLTVYRPISFYRYIIQHIYMIPQCKCSEKDYNNTKVMKNVNLLPLRNKLCPGYCVFNILLPVHDEKVMYLDIITITSRRRNYLYYVTKTELICLITLFFVISEIFCFLIITQRCQRFIYKIYILSKFNYEKKIVIVLYLG